MKLKYHAYFPPPSLHWISYLKLQHIHLRCRCSSWWVS